MCSNEQRYYQSSELETRDQLTAEQEKVKALVDALKELVALKNLKDSIEQSNSSSQYEYRWNDGVAGYPLRSPAQPRNQDERPSN